MNSLEKEFISYELALEMKQIGFNEPCLLKKHWTNNLFMCNGYDTEYSKTRKSKSGFSVTVDGFKINYKFELDSADVEIPTFSQCFRWFRENYPDLDFGIGKIYNGTNNYHYHINLKWEFFEGSYEEAEQECLKHLIKIVKDGKQ